MLIQAHKIELDIITWTVFYKLYNIKRRKRTQGKGEDTADSNTNYVSNEITTRVN